MVDALGDVGRLHAQRHQHAARAAVEALLGAVVADLEDPVACELGDVGVSLRRHLAGNNDHAGRDEGLHRDARGGVLPQQLVEDGVRDRVGNLVGVAFSD